MAMTRREFILCTTAGAGTILHSALCRSAGAESTTLLDISPLSHAVTELLENTPYNRSPGTETRVYDAPLFAVSNARDPLYIKLKSDVGQNHYLPEDLLSGAKTVISYFLPYSGTVSKANYGKDEAPALWLQAHRQGAKAAELVRRFIERRLTELNVRVVVPFHDSRYKTGTLVSNWSERHVAFISGLGTFGLHKNLITALGSAGRLDSVITDHDFAPTIRGYNGVYDHCINCHKCVQRCPVGAIKESGKNIRICAKHVLTGKGGPEQAVCGKCLTDVSCENCIPRHPDSKPNLRKVDPGKLLG